MNLNREGKGQLVLGQESQEFIIILICILVTHEQTKELAEIKKADYLDLPI
jgi:hypothetical protein